jgi:cell division protein FtsI (penicillin-binding protein 3)
MPRPEKNRIIFLFALFGLGFLAVTVKALKIQLLDRDDLLARSHSQFFREVKIYPKRGNIYDRSGNPLALNIQTYSIFALPKEIENSKEVAKSLHKIVPDLAYATVLKSIKERKSYTWIVRKFELEKEQVEKIKKIKGIYVESVPKRIYPNHELLSQVLGFVGLDNGGLAGIEYQFDAALRGKPISMKYVKDAKGRAIKFESREGGQDAKDITLSINKDLQAIVEKYLKDAVVESGAVGGGVGVMDASTGEVLAIANYPTYDPNEIRKSSPEERKLAFVSDPFEPGSVMKTLSIASALENGIVRPDTNYFCEYGRLKVDDHYITEAESNKKYEWLSVADILRHSSNVGTTKIAFDVTYPKLKTTFKKFGIGEKTGIEIPAESRGIFNESENVPPLTLSNVSFGQGVATTGIQMLAAYAAIANNGVYMRPTIIKDGNKDNEGVRVISKELSEELTSMLVDSVEDGTGGNAKIRYFKIAGKTSTAQRVSKNGGYKGYVPGFIGFPVNVEDRFAIFVYVDDPKGSYYGNTVAAPVFRKIAQYLLYRSKDFEQLALTGQGMSDAGLDAIKVRQSSTRFVSQGTVPDFVGLDKGSAKKLAEGMNYKVIHNGIGIVREQSPKPGHHISDNQEVTLQYAPPVYE